MLWDTLNCGLFSVCFDRHDVIDGIKIWKRRALSTQNELIMKKQNEVNQCNSFYCIIRTRIFVSDGWTERQMISNAIVTLVASAANSQSATMALLIVCPPIRNTILAWRYSKHYWTDLLRIFFQCEIILSR